MATKRVTQQTTLMPLKLIHPRDEAKNRLGERIEKGLELKQRKVDTRESIRPIIKGLSEMGRLQQGIIEATLQYGRTSERV